MQKGKTGEIILQYGEVFHDSSFYVEGSWHLNLNTYKNDGTVISCAVEERNFEDLFRTRTETKIDLNSTQTVSGDPVSAIPFKPLLLHSKTIVKELNADVVDDAQKELVLSNSGGGTRYIQYGFDQLNISELSFFTLPYEFNNSIPVSIYNVEEDGEHEVIIDYDVTMFLRMQYHSPANMGGNVRLYLVFETSSGTENVIVDEEVFPFDGQTEYVMLTIDRRLTNIKTYNRALKAGDKVKLYGRFVSIFNSGVATATVTHRNTAHKLNFRVVNKTKAASSVADAYLIYDALRQNIKLITDNKADLMSNFFQNGCGKKSVVLTGFMLRNFSLENRPPFTSIDLLYRSLKSIYCVGMGVEKNGHDDIIRIEPVDYFFQDVEILHVDDCFEYHEEVAQEFIYNEVEIGYSKFAKEEVNTLDEFNTRHEYLTPITTYKQKLRVISDMITSGYDIEFTRREQFKENPSKSHSRDNDIYLIAINEEENALPGIALYYSDSEGWLAIDGEFTKLLVGATQITIIGSFSPSINKTYVITNIQHKDGRTYFYTSTSVPHSGSSSSVTAAFNITFYTAERLDQFELVDNLIDADSSYNLRLSPKRMMQNWAKIINSGLFFKPASNEVHFMFGEGNVELRTRRKTTACMPNDPDRSLIKEKDSIALSDNNQFKKLFRPEWIVFKTLLTPNQVERIRWSHQNASHAGDNYGYISVTDYNGNTKSGYLFEMAYNPFTGEAEFKLLRKA
jgi:hypothetical protein